MASPLADFETAQRWKVYSKDLAFGAIAEASTADTKKAVQGLLKGEVIQGTDLFKTQ